MDTPAFRELLHREFPAGASEWLDPVSRRSFHLHYAREFAVRGRVTSGENEMNRLYAVESSPSSTGSIADHRLPLRAGDVEVFAPWSREARHRR
ncbi:MAG: TAT-variant-translocated molybdopterin oxidoreductase [Candidatus Binatia bacterium]